MAIANEESQRSIAFHRALFAGNRGAGWGHSQILLRIDRRIPTRGESCHKTISMLLIEQIYGWRTRLPSRRDRVKDFLPFALSITLER